MQVEKHLNPNIVLFLFYHHLKQVFALSSGHEQQCEYGRCGTVLQDTQASSEWAGVAEQPRMAPDESSVGNLM